MDNIMIYADQKLLRHLKFILICVLLGVVARLLPHPPNVTPLIALSLFAGSQFSHKIAFIMVSAIMLISDGLLAFLYGFTWFGNWSIFTYSGVLIITLIANQILCIKNQLLLYIFFSTLGFWCWTNFGVWIGSGFYPHTMNGLLNCYLAAVPFLKNALIGDLIWSGVIFGSFIFFRKRLLICAF